MKPRILFAIHGPPDPGTAVFLNVTMRAEYLRHLGHDVDILTPADFGTGGSGRLQPLTLPLALARRDLSRYDVVIFHSYLGWAYELLRRTRAAHQPAVIVAFHGLEPLYHEAVAAELARTGERLSARFHLLHRVVLPELLARACRRADGVLCLNSRERGFLLAQRWAVPDRVAIVANGIHASLFSIPRSHPETARRILFIGQWLRAKGIRYVAAAFEKLAAEFPEVELTCAGTGAAVETVLQSFERPVRSRVRVVPRFTRDELTQELSRADLFMFPSLSEGSSGAVLEAMAAGLPIVTTAAGAAPDVLADGIDARLVPFADASALAAEVGGLIPDRARREALGSSARQTARQYTWERANEQFAAEILRMAAGRS